MDRLIPLWYINYIMSFVTISAHSADTLFAVSIKRKVRNDNILLIGELVQNLNVEKLKSLQLHLLLSTEKLVGNFNENLWKEAKRNLLKFYDGVVGVGRIKKHGQLPT